MSGALALLLAAAPLADVWPYAVRHQPDGSLEYVYDLSLVKRAGGTPDAIEAHGETQVAAFLKALPREARVRVGAGTPLDVSAGRGPEGRPLANAFAFIFDGAIESENPLSRRVGPRLRPALDPDEPKVLVSAEALAWQVRTLEDQALAAVEVDTEWMRREVWSKVAERAVADFKVAQGDEREGALALAARAIAANACLDATKVAERLKGESEVMTAVNAELARLTVDPDARFAPPPYSWSPELTCAWVRQRALGAPLERSRAGTAAVLVFFKILDQDPKLKGLDARIRQRRDRFVGAPLVDRLASWRPRMKASAAEALEGFAEFIEALPERERQPPALLAEPSTPFLRFLRELTGPERATAWEELASAVQDGRLSAQASAVEDGGNKPSTPKERTQSWPLAREASLMPWLLDSAAGQVDSAWRDQRKATFAALLGGAFELRATPAELDPETVERAELAVRLAVPPSIELEPMPELYTRLAQSLELLADALSAENLGTLRGFTADGRRLAGDPLLAEAKRLATRLKALAVLASPEGKDSRALAEARRFTASWRSEPALASDVRAETAFFLANGGERAHAAILGVTRRELSVGFAGQPKVEVVGAPPGLTTDLTARQRYIVPVLKSVASSAPTDRRSLERASFKAAIDAVLRDPTKAEGAVIDLLHQ